MLEFLGTDTRLPLDHTAHRNQTAWSITPSRESRHHPSSHQPAHRVTWPTGTPPPNPQTTYCHPPRALTRLHPQRGARKRVGGRRTSRAATRGAHGTFCHGSVMRGCQCARWSHRIEIAARQGGQRGLCLVYGACRRRGGLVAAGRRERLLVWACKARHVGP